MSFSRSGSVIVEVKSEIEVDIDIPYCRVAGMLPFLLVRDTPESRRSRHKTAPAKLRIDAIPPEATSFFGMLVPVEAGLLRRWTREHEPGRLSERLPGSMFIGIVHQGQISFHSSLLEKVPPAPSRIIAGIVPVGAGVE
jgi:hypothetical protein